MKILICEKNSQVKTKINKIFCFSTLVVPSVCFLISSQRLNFAKEKLVEIRCEDFANIMRICMAMVY